MPEIVESPFRLTQDDPVIVEATGTADAWSDIFKYQVPIGVSLIIKPEHTFSCYLEDASAQVATADGEIKTCMIRIEKRDASGSDVRVLYGPKIYLASKQFVDVNRLAHFNVPPEGVIINEREYLVIVVLDDGAINETNSYFEMRIAKVRKALGA